MKRKTKKTVQVVIITIIMLIASLLCIFPFYWMILNSFKQPLEIFKVPVDIFTFNLTLTSYKAVFQYEDGIIWRAYLNSIFIALCSTLGTLFTSSLAAFAFAKLKFKGNKALYALFIATLMIPGQVTMLPLFVIFTGLRWTDTFLPLIVPGVLINTYGVFMLRSFIVSIPNELLEAAEVDGATSTQVFFKITLPLLRPILIYVVITSLIGGLQLFDVPQILTNGTGNPMRSTMTLIMYLNKHLYSKNYGMAGALSVVLFIITSLLSLLVFKVSGNDKRKG